MDNCHYTLNLLCLIGDIAANTNLIDVIIELEAVLNLLREDVLSAFCDDDVLLTSCEIQIVSGVKVSYVSGIQPTVLSEDFSCCLRILLVSLHDH